MYNYEKLMEQEGLELSALPEDARIGIETIAKMNRVIALTESKGKKIRPEVHKKIAANDKWVTREILDFLENKDSKQTPKAPHTEEEIKKDIEQDAVDPKGVAIDEELKALVEKGIKELKAAELKEKAPTAYSVIFQNYEDGGENGVDTTYYEVRETEAETFTIKTK